MRLIHKKTLIVFVFVALVILSLLCGGVGGKAYAAVSVSGYSDVLDDLEKDESFNSDDYPAIDGDYSLQVIQVAESTAGELFVYVYQPAANAKQLTATQINMSLTEEFSSDMDNTAPLTDLYDLTLLNRNGVFAKYKVDFKVKTDVVRYYNITSIYRLWDGDIDEGTGNDSTINEVSFPVGKLFTAETFGGQVSYKCYEKDVVIVSNMYPDTLRYENGHSGYGIYLDTYTDSHIVAFSTDWDMSDLYDVDISFYVQPFEDLYSTKQDFNLGRPCMSSHYTASKTKKTILVKRTSVGENVPSGWLKSNYYSWNRIQTVDNFKSNCGINLSSETVENLKGKQWVLQFYETDYSVLQMGQTVTVDYTRVTSVTVLRLHFKSNGVVYNLGAVSNKVSDDGKPGNEEPKKSLWDYFIKFCKWLESVTGLHYIVWAIILLAVPCGAILGILSIFIAPLRFALGHVFKGIGYGIYYAGYALVWLISRPFVGIKALIDKLSGN